MPLTLTINPSGFEDRLAEMQEKLEQLPLADELTAWQVEDMNRAYPQTDSPNPTYASTMIYPRSRTYDQRRRVATPKRARTPQRRLVRRSKRPILRAELFERLRQRLAALLQRELKW